MKRTAFIDWFRGLCCILMIQTHVFESYLAPPYRQGFFWELTVRQIGGMPSRLFLFLAGISLMLRFSSDERRQIPPAQARRGTMLRGLEILALALLFRVTEWALGGAGLWRIGEIAKVDILNCIGLSLVLGAALLCPRMISQPRFWLRPLLLLLPVVFLAPVLERHNTPAIPSVLRAYVVGLSPLAAFPIFPWFGYFLAGSILGTFWLRAGEALPRIMQWTGVVGALLTLGGQIAYRLPYRLPLPLAAPGVSYSTPTAYFYRTGLCLLLAWLSFRAYRQPDSLTGPARPIHRALLLLGRHSLFVYWVHIELVYGHASDLWKHRLSPSVATAALLLLSLLMLLLTSLWEKYRKRSRRA